MQRISDPGLRNSVRGLSVLLAAAVVLLTLAARGFASTRRYPPTRSLVALPNWNDPPSIDRGAVVLVGASRHHPYQRPVLWEVRLPV